MHARVLGVIVGEDSDDAESDAPEIALGDADTVSANDNGSASNGVTPAPTSHMVSFPVASFRPNRLPNVCALTKRRRREDLRRLGPEDRLVVGVCVQRGGLYGDGDARDGERSHRAATPRSASTLTSSVTGALPSFVHMNEYTPASGA